jgi:hypothetical protein
MARRTKTPADAKTRRTPHPAALQTGGTRGSSNEGGPDRSGEPEKDTPIRMNTDADAGSRATEGRPGPEPRAAGEEDAEAAQAPRGPLPDGARPEDYVGGRRPHKTRTGGGTPGASGRRNEVL